jgi:4-hydroxy-4-methyl-2-oxoglutarate aldolase
MSGRVGSVGSVSSVFPRGERQRRVVLNDKQIADVGRTVSSIGDSADAISGLKCADLVDAMGRVHRHRCHVLDLASPTPGRVLFGAAVTISYYPSCTATLDPQRYNFANLFHQAVGDQPAGKVLVLASNGYTDVSMGGGTKLFRLQEHGLAGVLTDGRLRDFEELAGYDFAAYCSGEATHWGGDVVTPFQANVPVVVGGVGVMPGQYVYADAAGAVVIPRGEVVDVLAEARRIAAEDEALRARIAGEVTSAPPTGASER